jgi:hypothetical protein
MKRRENNMIPSDQQDRAVFQVDLEVSLDSKIFLVDEVMQALRQIRLIFLIFLACSGRG